MRTKGFQLVIPLALMVLAATPVGASSHMDAPLITLDDAANTTDVYAFVSDVGGLKYLTMTLAVFPFEEPGIGPNAYRFDEEVRYEIHVATGDDVAAGRSTFSYWFRFASQRKNKNTILQRYLGVIDNVDDASQNFTQTYTVTRVDQFGVQSTLGTGIVPPNNQGNVTPQYNQLLDGEMKAKEGVADEGSLDLYTRQAIANLSNGYRAFAGQRDDGFYADIQSIFYRDFTFAGSNKPFASQGGYNVHTIVLQIPVSELGGDAQVVGVYGSTSRASVPGIEPANSAGIPRGQTGYSYRCVGSGGPAGEPLIQRGARRHRGQGSVQSNQPDERFGDVREIRRRAGTSGGIGSSGESPDQPNRSCRDLHSRYDPCGPVDGCRPAGGEPA